MNSAGKTVIFALLMHRNAARIAHSAASHSHVGQCRRQCEAPDRSGNYVAFAFGSPVWTRSWNGAPATTMHVYEMSTTICECAHFLQSNSGITWHGPGTLDLSVTCDRAGGRSLRSQ